MEQMDSTYHVGDRVRVVGVSRCVWGANSNMRRMVGKEYTIGGVYWEDESDCYRYSLMNEACAWDDSCFEFASPPELPEFDTSGADVASLFC